MGKKLSIGLLGLCSSALAYAADVPPICDDADHCVWIMENHGPHEFDYGVLMHELEGFGQEGTDFLIMLIGDKDADIAGRAIDILYEGRFKLNAKEAREIIGVWPGANIEKMANLMVKLGTPDVQGRMIESLLHEDKKVRDVARQILARMREARKIYQLRPFEHSPLAKAVLEEPTRELVQMLAAFPAEKTRPFLQRALTSPDGPSVIAAYEALYKIDKELAFQSLLDTLRNLKPDQTRTAFALGELLRHRHANRADGFYMQFAKELAEDPKMSLMGRVAGLDAVLGGQVHQNGKSSVSLEPSIPVKSAFIAALNARADNIHPYEANFRGVFTSDTPSLAMTIWAHIRENQQTDGRIYENFFQRLETIDHVAVQEITLQALSEVENVKTLIFGLESARSQTDEIYLTSVKSLTNHWADPVRRLAVEAEESLKDDANENDNNPETLKRLVKENKTRRRECSITGKPQTDYVLQLPYFTLEEQVKGSFVKRRFVRASYPTKDGWFVGFNAPKDGGLWYFENESGLGDPLDNSEIANVHAIMPVKIPAPGRYAYDFWIISSDPSSSSGGQIYRARQDNDGLSVQFHRFLPQGDFAVSILPNNRYLLSHQKHSPLILNPDGVLGPACE